MGDNRSIMGFLKENLSDSPVIRVEMDFSNSTWEKKESFKSFCGDTYDERIVISKNAFINAFNKSSRDLTMSDSNGSDKFHIVVKVNNLSRRVSLMRIPPRIKVEIEGVLMVVETATGTVVKTMNYDLMGEEDLAPADRLAHSFELLAKKFVRS